MEILAHRGLWRHPDERNSLAALRAAFAGGFGVETDIRDHAGQVVISHDPPGPGGAPTLEQLLEVYTASGSRQMLALNVKSDGLHGQVARALTKVNVAPGRYFLFDMAVPEALGYLQRNMPCFTRESEIESVPAFIDRAAGVWLDCFFGDWIDGEAILKHHKAGRRVALVSPELHGRDRSAAWQCWREVNRIVERGDRHQALMICTDFPVEAKAYFDAED